MSNVRAMRGEFGDESGGTVDMGPMTYRPDGEQGIAEVAPEQCPAGHRLRYPNVKVGWDGVGRTYTCWTCHKAGAEVHTMRYVCGGRDDR